MENFHQFPFKIGQEAESKSHTTGFRGAWFRCKIKDIRQRGGNIWCSLEYFDFPDEKTHWTKAYQNDPTDRTSDIQQRRKELMLRPSFPPIYREHEISVTPTQYGLSAVFIKDWNVGDLVDWWSDGCFWSCRIVEILGKDVVQVDLPRPPIGEGKSYKANCTDLRPTLSWSIDSGWTNLLCKEAHLSKPSAFLTLASRSDSDQGIFVNHQVSTSERTLGEESLTSCQLDASKQILERQEKPRNNSFSRDAKVQLCNVAEYDESYTGRCHHVSTKECVLSTLDIGNHLVGKASDLPSFVLGHNNVEVVQSKCMPTLRDSLIPDNGRKVPMPSYKRVQARKIVQRARSYQYKKMARSHGHPSERIDAPALKLHSFCGDPRNIPTVISRKSMDFKKNKFVPSDESDSLEESISFSESSAEKSVSSELIHNMGDFLEDATSRKRGRKNRSFNRSRRYKEKLKISSARSVRKTQHQRYATKYDKAPTNDLENQVNGNDQLLPSTWMNRNRTCRKRLCQNFSTLELSVFALEELLLKVKWLKGVLKYGLDEWTRMEQEPSWRFVHQTGPAQGNQ